MCMHKENDTTQHYKYSLIQITRTYQQVHHMCLHKM